MRLLKALATAEELNCRIIHRKTGIEIAADYWPDMGFPKDFPKEGWELDDKPLPISFECNYLGCDAVDIPGGKRGAIYGFEQLSDASILTMMPEGVPVKVTITPL